MTTAHQFAWRSHLTDLSFKTVDCNSVALVLMFNSRETGGDSFHAVGRIAYRAVPISAFFYAEKLV